MYKTLLLAFVLSVIISCKKDVLVIQSIENYSRLAVGNYWIYDVYYTNSGGSPSYVGTDSIVISHDTLIRNNTYSIIEGTDYGSSNWGILNIVRDSSNYLVNHLGDIMLSTVDFQHVLRHYAFVPNPNDTIYI